MRFIPLKFILSVSLLGTMGVSVASHAQTLQSVGVDTVTSGMGEESLAPIPAAPKPVVTTPVAPVAGDAAVTPVAQDGIPAVAEAPADPFTIKGAVITLSGTTGFDRDAALEQGARDNLPGVLVAMGIPADKAAKNVKSLGSAMRFVKGYKVVKETLIPVYTLTADISFNGPMLQKNFGGQIPVAKKDVVESNVAVSAGAASEDVAPVAETPLKQWVVKINDRDPAVVDKIRVNLNAADRTRATYRLLTSAGAELLVDTPMDAASVRSTAGYAVEVTPLNVPMPTASVDAQGNSEWQGHVEGASY
ncbi:MAG: hypothetical protein DI585_02175 [Pseudomonas fluorescens]|nr:MAG: hypothetical protein DI585_02175 [Pseudomonas fluorescens]